MTTNFASLLEKFYTIEGLTLAQIATRLNMSSEGVRRALIEARVPRRPRGSPVGKHLPNGGENRLRRKQNGIESVTKYV